MGEVVFECNTCFSSVLAHFLNFREVVSVWKEASTKYKSFIP